MLVESILQVEREDITGPDYAPKGDHHKWGYQQGSVFIGDSKQQMEKPRAVKGKKEIQLPTYEKLKEKGAFSEELLAKLMAGLAYFLNFAVNYK